LYSPELFVTVVCFCRVAVSVARQRRNVDGTSRLVPFSQYCANCEAHGIATKRSEIYRMN
jgi:hypothetical protein